MINDNFYIECFKEKTDEKGNVVIDLPEKKELVGDWEIALVDFYVKEIPGSRNQIQGDQPIEEEEERDKRNADAKAKAKPQVEENIAKNSKFIVITCDLCDETFINKEKMKTLKMFPFKSIADITKNQYVNVVLKRFDKLNFRLCNEKRESLKNFQDIYFKVHLRMKANFD